jgi:hypothetical protein
MPPATRFCAIALSCSFLVTGCGGDSEEGSGGSGGSGASAGVGGSPSGGSGGSGGSSGGGGGSSGGTGGSSGGGGGSATGGGAGSTSVDCGSTTCGAGQYCCEPSCVDDAEPCAGFALHCDDASDCPNAFCCATSPPGGGFLVAECNQNCDADSQLIVCKHADASSCPSGMTCNVTAKLPPAYGFCN